MEEERYIIAQLTQGSDRVATKTLQWLCEHSREGFFFVDPSKVRSVIKLCLHRTDLGAKRWAINALAEVGPGPDVAPIVALVPLADNDPDLLVSIVAAVFSAKSEDEAVSILGAAGVSIEGLTLIAASQFSIAQKRRLVETLIPIEKADEAQLRAGIVLAGTSKAPEHLFDRNYTNAIALSHLNLHDVPSVSKYSVWALAELKLGFSSLSIPLSELESSPSELRKWILRLLFSDPLALIRNLEMIDVAKKDTSIEVREESAIELRNIYVDGMERHVRDWLLREEHHETKLSLLDHMASQSAKSSLYHDLAIDFYKREAPRSDLRVRMEAAAGGTPLYRELRRIDFEDESGSLFANDNENNLAPTVVNVLQNFSGSTIGTVVASGPASQETLSAIAGQKNDAYRVLLEQAVHVLAALPDKDRSDGELAVREVAEQPSKSKWKKLLTFLRISKEGIVATHELYDGVEGLMDNISDLLDIL